MNGNLSEHLVARARVAPTQIALQIPRRAGDRWVVQTSVTYRELDELVKRAAAGLVDWGLRPGDRAALMVPPSIEFFVLAFALFRLGAVPVLIDPGMGVRNLGRCLHEARPTAFLGIAKAQLARVILGWGRRSIHRVLTVSAGFFPWIWGRSYRGLMRRAYVSREPGLHQPAPDETAAILFTSGSTGAPKGAVYTHEIFQGQIAALRDMFQIEPGEVDLCTFPLFALFAPALGMTAVIPQMDFTRPALVDPENILGPIAAFQVRNMFGSPALLNRVGRAAEAAGVRLPSLKRVLSAGAPVSAEILRRFQSLLNPDASIYTPYGATESLPVAAIGSHEVLEETSRLTERGAGVCVGRAAPGVTIRIIAVHDEPIAEWADSLQLPVGEIGEIVVGSPMVTQAYDARPEATRLAKIHDPATGRMLHRMGDVGYFDATGRLWFCGRKSQRVVLADRTLFTDVCEGIFNAHPAVFRTALVGVDRSTGRMPVICVELESPHQPNDTIRRELLELAAQHDATREISTVLFHPQFPVDIRHNSKIFREQLAVWATRRLSSGR